jgi:hypothetical protein
MGVWLTRPLDYTTIEDFVQAFTNNPLALLNAV